ncbi:MAG: hypothetical protein ACI865_000023 [Flavobacteriaceae bacterium]|jgi:hypothetical protein
MKTLANISSFIITIVIIMAFASPEKKIDKLVSKIWKGELVEITQVAVPDSLQQDVIVLNTVSLDGKTVGYVCYAMAFGCQVGGCAAPTTPNSQSFETFDYIVVYDTELNILRVDIAEYGGQYGYEICRQKWLAQFIGGNIAFELDKNVDGISGATVSAKYLIDDLNSIGLQMKELDLNELTPFVSAK